MNENSESGNDGKENSLVPVGLWELVVYFLRLGRAASVAPLRWRDTIEVYDSLPDPTH